MTTAPTNAPLSRAEVAAWVDAFQENQRQIVEAHQRFQDAMLESQRAFLQAMEQAQRHLVAVMTQHAPEALAAIQQSAPVAPSAGAALTPRQVSAPARGPVLGGPAKPAQVIAPAAPQAPGLDLAALLLETVSQKTGYPVEMLTLDMELEGDLGIDSIKRVEIMSALQEQVPNMPEVDGASMANLATLGQILAHVSPQAAQHQAQATSPARDAASPSPIAAPAQQNSAGSGELDLAALLLETVSQKTGYPVEMLTLDMELEGDLGIDSIKRVEIMSALQEQVPNMPEVDGASMANLATLGQILEHVQARRFF